MPPKVERCVGSVLEENPDYSESKAWAICRAQFEAEVEEIPEIHELSETTLMADGLDALCERRPEWIRAESSYGTAWIGKQSGATVFQAPQERPGGYEYPEAGGEEAPPEVQEAVDRFRDDPDPDTPLLYWLLGTGTPAYKMAKADAEYADESETTETCAGCEYAYRGVDGSWICSQVAGEIQPEGWCRLWDGEEDLDLEGQLIQQSVGDDEWSAQMRVFRVVPAEGEEDQFNDDILGVGVNFPEAGVYVDWHREAFPDELDEPHVSEYGTISDFQKATNNLVVDYMPPRGGEATETQLATIRGLSAEALEDIERRFNVSIEMQAGAPMSDGGVVVVQQDVPENAVSVSDPSEVPEGAKTVTGPRGGLYYVPVPGSEEDDIDSGGGDWGSVETTGDLANALSEYVSPWSENPVDLEGVTDEMAVDYADALSTVERTGALDRMDTFSTTDGGIEMGHWNETDRRMYVNPDRVNPDMIAMDAEAGRISTDHPAHTILHEAGHALHFEAMSESELQQMNARELTEEEKEIADEVSDSAWFAPQEFVVEVFAGLVDGQEYDQATMDLYEELHGPEVPDGE